jgi:hypothetical protein
VARTGGDEGGGAAVIEVFLKKGSDEVKKRPSSEGKMVLLPNLSTANN